MDSLTPNQQRVFDVLKQERAPLGAYAILRKTGFRGATQVYRALAELTRLGLARKLESLNAYIACSVQSRSVPLAFAICDQCGLIHEVAGTREIKNLHEQLAQSNFQVYRTIVELHGLCPSCSGQPKETEQSIVKR